jgi:coenzyme F420-0:L-glutamate ligase / coenzyme F420-1:gamma-L-glutamate ligase
MSSLAVNRIHCGERLEVRAIPGIPLVRPGDDVAVLIKVALSNAGIVLQPSDVLVVTSKILSRAEGRFVDLSGVTISARASELATLVDKDPRLVELVLSESISVSRAKKGVLVVRHRLGFVGANAGIDASNAVPVDAPEGSGPWVLLLPKDPDRSAERIRRTLSPDGNIAVLVTDSFGRPFRLGTVGCAVGLAGLPPLWDRRGEDDLYGRKLEQTITGLADQVAAAADLVAGQAAERRAVVLVRGLVFEPAEGTARDLVRPPEEDLYA